jgi:hypothetical protein
MVLRDSGTGQMLAYAFRDGALVNLPNEQNFAAIGDPWVVLGFGKFSSQVPLGMITRNTVTNEFLIYDINQTFNQNNTPIYTAASAGTLIKSTDGVNSNMTLAGFAPIAGSSPFGATFDMVLRDNSSGKFYFYDIQNDKLANSGELLQPPPPSAPIDQAWTIGGIAPDFSSTASAGAASQLVQAMAGFGGGSGAGDGLSTAPLGADISQQALLTAPQHA